MPKRSKTVERRLETLQSKLEAGRVGEFVEFDALRGILPPDASHMTDSTMQHALKEIRQRIHERNPSLSLEIRKTAVCLIEVKDETLFDYNMKISLPQKRAIAAALWNWLFDLPMDTDSEFVESWNGNPEQNERIKGNLENKRHILRSRINPAIVIDAGSTTTVAIDRFIHTVPKIPLQVKEHKVVSKILTDAKGPRQVDEFQWYHKLIAPLFMTNSIVIADKIARSKFRQSIPLRIIGGTDRPERRSICGELALLWLRACDQEGKMISLDLAIIGSTGMETKRFDTWVLGCDAAEEASLKSRLLAMSNMRVVLLDSNKLINGSTGSMFASVSEGDIDLIITDSGKDKLTQKAVDKFATECNKNYVGLIIAKLPKNEVESSSEG